MSSTPRPAIQILPPEVAERIAAGEVVERPASVVKELVENAIDAGAQHIAVRMQEGGRRLVEVMDNGKGMSSQDLKLCTLRHATSKIHRLEDLDRLSSLGFRGEALPSIAAVAELEILSRPRSQTKGHTEEPAHLIRASLHNRDLVTEKESFGHFHGSLYGTRVRVQGLFSQVPARLKFLKSPRAEVSQVREWMERLALTHAEIQFELYNDDKRILHLHPQSEEDRVREILGDGNTFPVKTFENSTLQQSEIKIRLHWLQGLSLAQSRKMIQVVNGRVLKDRLIQSALQRGFKQILLPGQYPALALYLEIDPSTMDCNVHPNKTEVRFINGGEIFRSVEKAVEKLIRTEGAPAQASHSIQAHSNPQAALAVQKHFSKNSRGVHRPNQYSQTSFNGLQNKTPASAASPPNTWRAQDSQGSQDSQNLSDFKDSTTPQTMKDPKQTESPINPEAVLPTPQSQTDEEPQGSSEFDNFEYRCSLFATYLLFEGQQEFLILDQHAAHERIRYEELRQQILQEDTIPAAQELLMPEHVKFAPEDRHRVQDRMQWLSELGFRVELFGESALLFRAVPAAWGQGKLPTRLKNVLDRLLNLEIVELKEDPQKLRHLLLDEVLFESLASGACRSSVMAGDHLDPQGQQATSILQRLMDSEHPWNCPHGRPTVVKIPQGRMEEWFLRQV